MDIFKWIRIRKPAIFLFYFTILGWVKTLAFQAKNFNFTLLKDINNEKLWVRCYFVATTGIVADTVIMGNIENQGLGITNDDFRIPP